MVADNEILGYDAATNTWRNQTGAELGLAGGVSVLTDLTDVTITAATSGEFLFFNGTEWVDGSGILDLLEDVDMIGVVANNEILGFDSATNKWRNQTAAELGLAGGVSVLDDLTDVIITAATSGEFLMYNGTDWVDNSGQLDLLEDVDLIGVVDDDEIMAFDSATDKWRNQTAAEARLSVVGHLHPSGHLHSLDDLSTVIVPSPASGDTLFFNGSHWINESGTLDKLNDVVMIGVLAEDELLAYDTTEGRFTNKTASEAGLSVVGHLHPSGHLHSLDDLSTVIAPSPASGDFLFFDGAHWINESGTLDKLDDVIMVGVLADDDLLAYDTTELRFINQSASEAGLAASIHEHDDTYIRKHVIDDPVGEIVDGRFSMRVTQVPDGSGSITIAPTGIILGPDSPGTVQRWGLVINEQSSNITPLGIWGYLNGIKITVDNTEESLTRASEISKGIDITLNELRNKPYTGFNVAVSAGSGSIGADDQIGMRVDNVGASVETTLNSGLIGAKITATNDDTDSGNVHGFTGTATFSSDSNTGRAIGTYGAADIPTAGAGYAIGTTSHILDGPPIRSYAYHTFAGGMSRFRQTYISSVQFPGDGGGAANHFGPDADRDDLFVESDLEVGGTLWADGSGVYAIIAAANMHLGANYLNISNLSTPTDPPASTRTLFTDSGTGELSVRTSAGTTISLEKDSLGDLTDVTLVTPGSGDFLFYNGTEWTNIEPSGAGLGYLKNIVEDLSPQLGAGLDAQAFNITALGNLAFDADDTHTIATSTVRPSIMWGRQASFGDKATLTTPSVISPNIIDYQSAHASDTLRSLSILAENTDSGSESRTTGLYIKTTPHNSLNAVGMIEVDVDTSNVVGGTIAPAFRYAPTIDNLTLTAMNGIQSFLTATGAARPTTLVAASFGSFGAGTTDIALRTLRGDVIFNSLGEASAYSMDFRIESGTNTHLLFLDGSEDVLGLGKDDPSSSYILDATGDVRIDGIIDLEFGKTYNINGSPHVHDHSEITDLGVAVSGWITYETLDANGDVGTGAGQLAIGNHVHALDDLSDVDVAGDDAPDNQDVLTWFSASGAWLPAPASGSGGGGASILDDLTDVVITAETSGEFLFFNGDEWVNASGILDLLEDVDLIGVVADNEILAYDSATNKWRNQTAVEIGVATQLDELSDVSITADPIPSGAIITYDGTEWIDSTGVMIGVLPSGAPLNMPILDVEPTPTGVGDFWITDTKYLKTIFPDNSTCIIPYNPELDDLGDVSLGAVPFAPASGEFLFHDGTSWINESGILDNMEDVQMIGVVADNEILGYDSASDKWINQTAAELGLAGGVSELDDLTDVTMGVVPFAPASGEFLFHDGNS